jgi:hypothetical protein
VRFLGGHIRSREGLNPMCIQRIVALAVVTLTFFAAATAQEKIKRSELSATVERTVAATRAGATIRGFSEEKENG